MFGSADEEKKINHTEFITPHKHGRKVELQLVFEWKYIVYAYPTDIEEKLDIHHGIYKPGASVPFDVEVYYSSSCEYIF